MRTMYSREIFTKECRQQQIFDSDLKEAWHYNHLTITPIAKNFMLYCRLIYTLSILCVRLTIKVKVGIPESFKVGWYAPQKTGSSHLKLKRAPSYFANGIDLCYRLSLLFELVTAFSSSLWSGGICCCLIISRHRCVTIAPSYIFLQLLSTTREYEG